MARRRTQATESTEHSEDVDSANGAGDAVDTGEDTNETPEQRFIRLASARTTRVISFLRLLGNLAGKRKLYDFTPEQVERMFTAINAEVEATRERFDKSLRGEISDQPTLFSF